MEKRTTRVGPVKKKGKKKGKKSRTVSTTAQRRTKKATKKTAKKNTKGTPRTAKKTAAPRPRRKAPLPGRRATRGPDDVTLVGIDLGPSTTAAAAAANGRPVPLANDVFSTIVGFPKRDILPGILPANTMALFADEALTLAPHLNLKRPLRDGVIGNIGVCRLFVQHALSVATPGRSRCLWGVVGAPTGSFPDHVDRVRRVMSGDHVSLNEAGDFIDETILRGTHLRHPGLELTRALVREIKEEKAFVSGFDRGAKACVGDDSDLLNFADLIQETCNAVLSMIVESVEELLGRCDADSLSDLTRNIIVTGGGARIRGLAQKLEQLLQRTGYPDARTVVQQDSKRLAAHDALYIAQNTPEDEWQTPIPAATQPSLQ